MNFHDKIFASIISAILGDAMGVPVESETTNDGSLCSIKNMLGYGRFDQPEGTWSDDSSMILCTMDSLINGYNLEHLGRTFCRWLFDSYWTANGVVFDSGLTTFIALDRIRTENFSAHSSGCIGEDDNGNGSLMRILPAALYFYTDPVPLFLEKIHQISAITHAHPRSLVGCGIFSLLVKEILYNDNKNESLRSAIDKALEYYGTGSLFKNELPHFMRILSFELLSCDASEIHSSGYIVDTLEAAIWSFLKNESTFNVLATSINLGRDTDTSGTAAGGLAGLQYGLKDIPQEWLESLARKKEVETLITKFAHAIPQG
jgi:ADP-ribosylglycohydrolase